MDFINMSAQCAPNVAPQTMAAIVSVESSHNPYAIGVVGGHLIRQPVTKAEAIATVQQLERQGKNFSMGMAQVNRYNLPRYNVTYSEIFDACTNLRVGALILEDCYQRAMPAKGNSQAALRAAFSCYYSGNFSRGFQPDKIGEPSYVQKVVAASGLTPPQIVVPAIESESLPALHAADKAHALVDPMLMANEPSAAGTAAVFGEPVSGTPTEPVSAIEQGVLELPTPPGRPALVF